MAPSHESQRYENPALWSPSLWQSLEQDQQRANIMLASLPAQARWVLDVGCGNGIFTNLIRDETTIYGTDRSYAALLHVRASRCQASAEALPFPSACFDAVVCMEMLEHLPEHIYSKTLAEIARLSRDAILITVPYLENLRMNQVTCPQCACEFHPYYHMRSFDASTLIHLFDMDPGIQTEKILGICPAPARRFPALWNVIRSSYHRKGVNFPWYARCPQCGYASSQGALPADAPGPVRGLKSSLKNIWPHTNRYQWWLAIYRRK